MKYKFLVILFLLIFSTQSGFKENTLQLEETCLSKEEAKLYDLIMKYRKEKKLPKIQLSISLTHVAQTHARDIMENSPNKGSCNMHSWSNKGKWSACCYTNDHAKSECMWNKPK